MIDKGCTLPEGLVVGENADEDARRFYRSEQGDRDKPIQIEADRASLDQLKGITVYEGNVVVTQGTILLRAAQVTVTQDKNGGDLAVTKR